MVTLSQIEKKSEELVIEGVIFLPYNGKVEITTHVDKFQTHDAK